MNDGTRNSPLKLRMKRFFALSMGLAIFASNHEAKVLPTPVNTASYISKSLTGKKKPENAWMSQAQQALKDLDMAILSSHTHMPSPKGPGYGMKGVFSD